MQPHKYQEKIYLNNKYNLLIKDKQSLILLNNGDPIRLFNSFNGSLSAIDLTITNSNMAILLDWLVLTPYSGSDH